MEEFLKDAIDEAKKGLSEGGIPIGSVLVKDGEDLSGAGIIKECRKETR